MSECFILYEFNPTCKILMQFCVEYYTKTNVLGQQFGGGGVVIF